MVTHSQDGRGGVLATYAPPGGIVEVHRSPWFQVEPNFTQRNLKVYTTPAHRFFQISQSPFLLPVSPVRGNKGNIVPGLYLGVIGNISLGRSYARRRCFPLLVDRA